MVLVGMEGCSQRIGDFTVISTKNVDLGTNYVKIKSNGEGKDLKHWIIIFPIGVPNIKSAIDDSLNQNDGDVIMNAVIESGFWYIPYIYGQSWYAVKGDIYKKAKKVSEMPVKERLNSAKSDLIKAESIYKAVKIDGQLQLVVVDKDKVGVDNSTAKLTVQ
jgi:hypothetical protein